MKTLSLLVPLLVLALIPATGRADGMFVAPKFVWDKHKDINEPTQKAIIVYDNGQEDLILQVKYEGLVSQFGWLIPVPNKPSVQQGSMKCFYELSQLTQQRFEYSGGFHGFATMGLGTRSMDAASAALPPPVQVVEIKTVGAYEIAVLSAVIPARSKNGSMTIITISRRTKQMSLTPISNNTGTLSPLKLILAAGLPVSSPSLGSWLPAN
jgi:hypothetical protein